MSVAEKALNTSGVANREVFVGRQAIYDRDLRVGSYELLFRSGDTSGATFDDGEAATAELITTTFMDIGLDRIVGENRMAFINVTRDFLLERRAAPLPPERVVLEILENVEVDPILVEAVREHSADGFTIALDDFAFEARWLPLVESCDIVKIDVTALGLKGAQAHADLLAPHRKRLLAEKIETQAQYDQVRTMGYDLFQGYFLSKPNVMAGRRLSTAKLTLLHLLAALQDPRAKSSAIERLVIQDVGLSYKLLRLINSAFFSLRGKIESIQGAVVYLGLEPLKRWASLLVLASIDDKPSELLRNAIVRASMCERLAELSQCADGPAAFTLGLFSTLDVLMDRPLAEVVAELPLGADLRAALLERSGVLGELLDCVVAYEACDWPKARLKDLTTAQIRDAYLDAVEWAEQAAVGAGAG